MGTFSAQTVPLSQALENVFLTGCVSQVRDFAEYRWICVLSVFVWLALGATHIVLCLQLDSLLGDGASWLAALTPAMLLGGGLAALGLFALLRGGTRPLRLWADPVPGDARRPDEVIEWPCCPTPTRPVHRSIDQRRTDAAGKLKVAFQ